MTEISLGDEKVMPFSFSNFYQSLTDSFFGDLQKQVIAYREQGIDVIDLSIGNPDLPTPHPVVEAMERAVEKAENHRYPPFAGKPSTLEAIASFYQREYGVKVDPQTEIAIFQGACIGVLAIPRLLLNPGDLLLTTDPCYPAYRDAARFAGASVFQIPVYEQNHFLPDYTSVSSEILSNVKLLMLNYPNNPTGALATKDFYRKTLEFAWENHFPVVNDFAYGAFGYDGRKPISLLQMAENKTGLVEIYTASKTWNMAGWRFGFAVGDASLISALKRYHAHAYSTVFGAIQDAAAAAMLDAQNDVQHLLARYQRRRNSLIRRFHLMGWDVASPAGTFYVWAKLPEKIDSLPFSNALLREAHVAVAPGEGFGEQGRHYIRFSLTNPETRLLEAADRIERCRMIDRDFLYKSLYTTN